NGIEYELQIAQERLRDAIPVPVAIAQPSPVPSPKRSQINSEPVQESIFNPILEQSTRLPTIDAIKARLSDAKSFPELKEAIAWAWQPEQIGQISDVPAMLASVNQQIRSRLMATINGECDRLKWGDSERSRLLDEEFGGVEIGKLGDRDLLRFADILWRIPTPPLSEEEERAQMDLALKRGA
ncbi:MAG: hypothetical protein ACRC62_23775, partial [Microcoleus sp.]